MSALRPQCAENTGGRGRRLEPRCRYPDQLECRHQGSCLGPGKSDDISDLPGESKHRLDLSSLVLSCRPILKTRYSVI